MVKDYEELSSLGQLYNRDVNQVILDIIEAVQNESRYIKDIRKESKDSIGLKSVIRELFFAGGSAFNTILNPILDQLKVKGLYSVTELSFSFEDERLSIDFEAKANSNLQIDVIGLLLGAGDYSIITSSFVETEKINIEKLKKIGENVNCPDTEEYDEIVRFKVLIDEESATIQIVLLTETFEGLPSIRALSKFVEKLLKKAKM